MRSRFLLPGVILLALASGAGAQPDASAQAPAAVPDDAEAISSVRVQAPVRPLRIRDQQAAQITGRYALSNGWYLQVHSEPRHIVARIDHGDPIRLYAVAPYRFVSRDTRWAMEFNRGQAGEDMLLSYVPQAGLAAIVVGSMPMAGR